MVEAAIVGGGGGGGQQHQQQLSAAGVIISPRNSHLVAPVSWGGGPASESVHSSSTLSHTHGTLALGGSQTTTTAVLMTPLSPLLQSGTTQGGGGSISPRLSVASDAQHEHNTGMALSAAGAHSLLQQPQRHPSLSVPTSPPMRSSLPIQQLGAAVANPQSSLSLAGGVQHAAVGLHSLQQTPGTMGSLMAGEQQHRTQGVVSNTAPGTTQLLLLSNTGSSSSNSHQAANSSISAPATTTTTTTTTLQAADGTHHQFFIISPTQQPQQQQQQQAQQQQQGTPFMLDTTQGAGSQKDVVAYSSLLSPPSLAQGQAPNSGFHQEPPSSSSSIGVFSQSPMQLDGVTAGGGVGGMVVPQTHLLLNPQQGASATTSWAILTTVANNTGSANNNNPANSNASLYLQSLQAMQVERSQPQPQPQHQQPSQVPSFALAAGVSGNSTHGNRGGGGSSAGGQTLLDSYLAAAAESANVTSAPPLVAGSLSLLPHPAAEIQHTAGPANLPSFAVSAQQLQQQQQTSTGASGSGVGQNAYFLAQPVTVYALQNLQSSPGGGQPSLISSGMLDEASFPSCLFLFPIPEQSGGASTPLCGSAS